MVAWFTIEDERQIGVHFPRQPRILLEHARIVRKHRLQACITLPHTRARTHSYKNYFHVSPSSASDLLFHRTVSILHRVRGKFKNKIMLLGRSGIDSLVTRFDFSQLIPNNASAGIKFHLFRVPAPQKNTHAYTRTLPLSYSASLSIKSIKLRWLPHTDVLDFVLSSVDLHHSTVWRLPREQQCSTQVTSLANIPISPRNLSFIINFKYETYYCLGDQHLRQLPSGPGTQHVRARGHTPVLAAGIPQLPSSAEPVKPNTKVLQPDVLPKQVALMQ